MFKGMTTTTDKPTVDKVEEVSLIMALGRVNANVQQEGPSPSDTISGRFSNQIAELATTMEQSFRDKHNFVKLKADLAVLRLFAEYTTLAVRKLDVTSKEVEEDPGIYVATRTSLNSTSNYAQLVYGDSFSWSWGYYIDGEWSKDVANSSEVPAQEEVAVCTMVADVILDR